MFGLSEAQSMAIIIMASYFCGVSTVLAVLFHLIARSEEKGGLAPRHRKHKMEVDEDLSYIDEALAVIS